LDLTELPEYLTLEMDELANVAAVFSSQERLHELGVPREYAFGYDWRDGLILKEVGRSNPGRKWANIWRKDTTCSFSGVTQKWVKDNDKARFDWEDPTRTDLSSVCGRLLRDGEVPLPDCDVIIVSPPGKLSKMLDEPKFHHLKDDILPFPPNDRGIFPKKEYIWVGREGNRRPNDGAIMDLINSSFRPSRY
jgi:hypothetical protein